MLSVYDGPLADGQILIRQGPEGGVFYVGDGRWSFWIDRPNEIGRGDPEKGVSVVELKLSSILRIEQLADGVLRISGLTDWSFPVILRYDPISEEGVVEKGMVYGDLPLITTENDLVRMEGLILAIEEMFREEDGEIWEVVIRSLRELLEVGEERLARINKVAFAT